VAEVIWSAAACRRFHAGSSLPAAAASRGRESGAQGTALQSRKVFAMSFAVRRRAALQIVALYDSPVNIETRKKGDVIIVDFQGRLAVGVGDELLPRLIEQLLNEGNKKILLNLSDMDYIDSNGLGELVQSLKTSKRFGASLRLLKPQDRVRKTLRLTNLLPMFSVYETEADALEGFATES